VRLPGVDGKDLDWWRSSREAAELATKHWIRVRANMSLGGYDCFRAECVISDPEWPELDYWLECAPSAGQDQAAVLTVCRAW
jgi:hypothetical protein